MWKRRTKMMLSIARNPNPIIIEVPKNPSNEFEFNDNLNEEFLMLCDSDDTCNSSSEITINEVLFNSENVNNSSLKSAQSIVEDHSMHHTLVKDSCERINIDDIEMIAQSNDDEYYVDPRINEVVIQNENITHTEVSDQQSDSMQHTLVKVSCESINVDGIEMIAQSDDDEYYVESRINEVVLKNENKTHTEVSDQQSYSIQHTLVKVSCESINVDGIEMIAQSDDDEYYVESRINEVVLKNENKTHTEVSDQQSYSIQHTLVKDSCERINIDDIEMIAQSDDVEYVEPGINEVVIQNENITHTEVSDQQSDGRNKNTGEMKRITAKNQRMHGKKYTGYHRQGKTVFQNIDRENRKVKPRCNSSVCRKSKKCNLFSEEDRSNLFECFWSTTWEVKKSYIINLVEKADTKRKTNGEDADSRRSVSFKYHLRDINDTKLNVCKKMFLATLDLSDWMVHNWLKSSEGLSPKNIKTNNQNKKDSENEVPRLKTSFTVRYEHFTTWFSRLPVMESHYCRKQSNRLYLEGPFDSKQQLYNLYLEEAKEFQIEPVSRSCFSKYIKSKKFSLYKPRKDQCDICCSFKTHQVSEEVYNKHILNKNMARLQLDIDTEKAKNLEKIVFTMDVQAVKLCPAMNASALYYSMKLKVHNFTLYNVGNEHDCHNYWWNECEGELEASVFVSIIIHHLKTYCIDDDNKGNKKDIILYSDGCGYQNRNSVLSSALLNFAVLNNVVIEQKFLEKGHTQMSCDSVHSCIERKLKNTEIHLPSDFIRVTKEARVNPSPYKATLLDHTFFTDYKKNQTYSSIRPGKGKGDPEVRDLRCLKYDPATKMIYFKTIFSDSYEMLPLPRNKYFKLTEDYEKLYSSQLPLTLSKWTDLQKLKHVLPIDTHSFYDTLPHAASYKQRKVQDI